jgi:hypothetical protein
MAMIGIMYAQGCGVPRDLATAAVWIQKAADAGDKDAQEWLKTHVEELNAVELRDPNSDIRLPPTLGPLCRGSVTDFETRAAGGGTGIGYNSTAVTATVYLYTLGLNSMPDGIESAPVKEAFEGAVKDIE